MVTRIVPEEVEAEDEAIPHAILVQRSQLATSLSEALTTRMRRATSQVNQMAPSSDEDDDKDKDDEVDDDSDDEEKKDEDVLPEEVEVVDTVSSPISDNSQKERNEFEEIYNLRPTRPPDPAWPPNEYTLCNMKVAYSSFPSLTETGIYLEGLSS